LGRAQVIANRAKVPGVRVTQPYIRPTQVSPMKKGGTVKKKSR
jgi:hypothetical protein